MENEEEISIKEYLQMLLVTCMRIYDVQTLILFHQNEEAAIKMQDDHSKMNFIGPYPWKADEKGE